MSTKQYFGCPDLPAITIRIKLMSKHQLGVSAWLYLVKRGVNAATSRSGSPVDPIKILL